MKKGKNCLFISYDGLTDPLGQSQILPYLKGLSKAGYIINVLSCEKQESFSLRSSQIRQDCDKNNINWNYCFYKKSPPIISTILDILEMKSLANSLNEKSSFDIIHCRTILATLVGFSIQNLGAKLIFDIRGFWADERVDGKLWNLNNPIYKFIYNFFKRKEYIAFKKADHIITLTESAKNELIIKYSLTPSKIDVVPCTVDLNHFSRQNCDNEMSEEIKNQVGIKKDDIVICYSGSLGTRYLIKEMLECFVEINKLKSSAIFLIITNHNTNDLLNLAIKLGISDKLKICSTDYKSIPSYLNLADIGLYFIFAGNSGKAVSPTKQAEFLSLGKPIITNKGIGDSSDLIQDFETGLVIEKFNKEEYLKIANRIEYLQSIPKERMIKLSKQVFDLEKGVATYVKVYAGL